MEWQLRKAMVEHGARVQAAGLVAASDGNISVRLDRNRFLITPSGLSLGELTARDIVAIDGTGREIAGARKKSSEYRLHLAIYDVRADVQAIIHAHPPTANAFTFAQLSLENCVVPEVAVSLGSIPTTAYATPSTQEGADVIRGVIRDHDAVMLQRHGSVTVGAKVLLAARILGRVQPLSEGEIHKLAHLREEMGLGAADDVLRACGLNRPGR
jgi:L-fuculose-phosphate aldolase